MLANAGVLSHTDNRQSYLTYKLHWLRRPWSRSNVATLSYYFTVRFPASGDLDAVRCFGVFVVVVVVVCVCVCGGVLLVF